MIPLMGLGKWASLWAACGGQACAVNRGVGHFTVSARDPASLTHWDGELLEEAGQMGEQGRGNVAHWDSLGGNGYLD